MAQPYPRTAGLRAGNAPRLHGHDFLYLPIHRQLVASLLLAAIPVVPNPELPGNPEGRNRWNIGRLDGCVNMRTSCSNATRQSLDKPDEETNNTGVRPSPASGARHAREFKWREFYSVRGGLNLTNSCRRAANQRSRNGTERA